jgi:hypothetical protein
MVKEGIGTVFQETIDRKPITNPHVMFMAIGDCNHLDEEGNDWRTDRSPLQVTQFEADLTITDQIEKIHVEGNGGGNHHESYSLAWYFAATKTSIDSFDKRGKKGYLFTVGDEEPNMTLFRSDIKRIFNEDIEAELSIEQVLAMAQRQWHVFHVIIEQGNHASHYLSRVQQAWRNVLGENVISLSDYTKLAEVVVSTMQITEGLDAKTVASSWSGDTSIVVQNATRGLVAKPTGRTDVAVRL